MSVAWKLTLPPSALISDETFSPPAASRSRMPTAQPSSASRRAIAAPMPLAPPVTRTVRSFNPRISAPRLSRLHVAPVSRAACQHPGGFVSHHHLVVLVLHVDP